MRLRQRLPSPFRTWIEEHKMRVAEVASKLGVSPARVYQLLAGVGGPPALGLAKAIFELTGGAVSAESWGDVAKRRARADRAKGRE